MKALIPAAGRGMRMRPFTHTKPKSLIYVAGKPVIAHILEDLVGVVEEVVVVVGYMGDLMREYLEKHYSDRFRFTFVQQDRPRGLGHAVYLGLKEDPDDSYLITLGDEFFEMDYSLMLSMHQHYLPCAGTLGIKTVEDPRDYGVATLNNEVITALEEKPAHPRTNTAIAGVYFIEDTPLLLSCLEEEVGKAADEVQLTDALQSMVDRGALLKSFPVSDWYDCGRPGMLLKVNQILLKRKGSDIGSGLENTIIIDPVVINDGCTVSNSILGPNVSINSEAQIDSCIITNSIIGFGARIENKILKKSIIGDHAEMRGKRERMHVGDRTEIFED